MSKMKQQIFELFKKIFVKNGRLRTKEILFLLLMLSIIYNIAMIKSCSINKKGIYIEKDNYFTE